VGAAFFFLFKGYQGDTPSSFEGFGDTAMMVFGMTLGEYEVYLHFHHACFFLITVLLGN